MKRLTSNFVLAIIVLTSIIAATPFIAYLTDYGPSRLWPSFVAVVLLIFTYILYSHASNCSKSYLLHFCMSLCFLSLIFIGISWIGIPFIDAIFLAIGNIALILLPISVIFGVISTLRRKKSV